MIDKDTVIRVENLSKQYRLGLVGTGSLGHDLNRWWAKMLGKPDPYLKIGEANDRTQKGVSEYVWALKDINFEVKQGEVLGIIGRNGAGKSTLLKILSRVTAPTTGYVKIKGRVASLLEVGTGFHPELTGRENVYLNGAINGMTRAEVTRKLDEIIDFSGCERYIDTPVKRYSSGMMVRLGFAVAAHLEPEILIVDEVLAVGDAEFQKKCIGKMEDVAGHGRTVLFVSHNLASIQNLCRAAIWLDQGAIAMANDTASAVVMAYQNSSREASGVVEIQANQHMVHSPLKIRRLELIGLGGVCSSNFKYGEPLRFRVIFSCREAVAGVSMGIALYASGVLLTTLLSKETDIAGSESFYALECKVPRGILWPGMFHLDIGAARSNGKAGLDYIRDVATFSVSDVGISYEWNLQPNQCGVMNVPGEWSMLQYAG